MLTAAALATAFASAQEYNATVIDAKTGDPIPFATVQTGEHSGTITNSEGAFSLTANQVKRLKDSIYVSSMGYQKMGILVSAASPTTIELAPKTMELDQVLITNQNLDADEIIDRVKENLQDNYAVGLSQHKVFFRQSDYTEMQELQFTVKKSSIPELNQELMNQITASAPKNSWYYRETLADFYGNYQGFKININKAAELYDKSKDVSMDGMTKKLERIFKENVKRDSYLKIKSGIIGTKIELDSTKNNGEKNTTVVVDTVRKPEQYQNQVMSRLGELYEQLFFKEETELDFLEKSNRYNFERDGYTFINSEPVYIIHFTPRGRKDFTGTMYINTSDYAIMRLDFNNVRPTNKFGFFGITYRRNVLRGKMLFVANKDGKYRPQYFELEDGQLAGVDRPLKVIEKNKNVSGRRKQNELSMDMLVKVNSLTKYEFVVFDAQDIDQNTYKNTPSKSDVVPTYLSAYDPSFWEGYTIMEPNAAIQAFKVIEEN